MITIRFIPSPIANIGAFENFILTKFLVMKFGCSSNFSKFDYTVCIAIATVHVEWIMEIL